MSYKIGLDIGSTTIKSVVLDKENNIVYKSYERHFSKVRQMAYEKIEFLSTILRGEKIKITITGSAGLGVSKETGIDFVQEVFATAGAVKRYQPKTDVVIELGGEDAKIIFLKGAIEERMNSTCAGGTGAFIDQMASLLNCDLQELDEASLQHTKIYPIASRCGVFAKTDIQPLINQGAQRSNIGASIFQAVVDQTIAGLAQGKPIEGTVLFLGGPLSFLKGLQQRFTETLKLQPYEAIFPPLAPYFIALGAAIYCEESQNIYTYEQLEKLFLDVKNLKIQPQGLPPLFADEQDYENFKKRHQLADVASNDIKSYEGNAYLGVDAGSTTTKTVLVDENLKLLYSSYKNNLGNPVDAVKEQLTEIYEMANKNMKIASSAVTGYGEDLIKNAFFLDMGLVETVAHKTAASHFNENVDFIIDIGGQDMKCFKIVDKAIDNIILNEACSSGCGSFIETFSKSLGYPIDEFAKMGLFAQHPVDLGTRCTVFMNSSVKEAQKNGATVADISAGLAISVVKNALYKVIRAKSKDEIGENIVVQGGTFLNDSVLRSFEKELGRNVLRPKISGLMGAFGSAIFAKNNVPENKSDLITPTELESFSHTSNAINCNLCTNHCSLTVNTFNNRESNQAKGRQFIAGNRCERPITGKSKDNHIPDMIEYKYNKLMSFDSLKIAGGVKIGIPMALNMYENLPFWHKFFTELGFEVVLSGRSTKTTYLKGQNTISSDTICYPAKITNGHIRELEEKGVKTIFYPCMTFNFEEEACDKSFNCPVVAYYPEVIDANVTVDNGTTLIRPYISLNNKKVFDKKIREILDKVGYSFDKKVIENASKCAYESYDEFKLDILAQGKKSLEYARKNDLPSLIVVGRPYHCDPQINHGINKLMTGLGFAVLTEDSVVNEKPYVSPNVLNQWTYHARMYSASHFVVDNKDTQLVQLVSFGCGLDAITTDEIRDIVREGNKLYTQIKIDEIDNLSAIKIRIRSLSAAINAKNNK